MGLDTVELVLATEDHFDICDQLGVHPDRVMPEARFIQDLGMD